MADGVGIFRHSKDTAEQRRFEQATLMCLDALYGFAVSLTRNPVEAEDLVQETCLRAIKRAHRAVPQGDVKPWLFTILRNIWINQQRRRARGPEFVPLEEEMADVESGNPWLINEKQRPDALLAGKLLKQQIRAAIESLPPSYREVILLRCIEGFSYSQIAQILDCPAGTVMSRLSRARAELRRRLRQEAGGCSST